MSNYLLAILPGDGIGPEIMRQAVKVLDVVGDKFNLTFTKEWGDVGGVAIDHHGEALPEATLELCRQADAILFGSIGGPRWEHLPPQKQPERAALLPLRKIFNLYANLRPAIVYPELIDASPLKADVLAGGIDLLVIRELTGGIYFGEPKGREADRAFDTLLYRRSEIERIARLGFETAKRRKKKLTSIDKANVLTSMVFWREIVEEVGKAYPEVDLKHMYVDNAAMQLIRDPGQFDVLLCGNMFGDILSDEASMLTGSLGMLPSASLTQGRFGLYEPCGGSAPDIAGQGLANPIAQILSLSMLLRYSLDQPQAAASVEHAVRQTLAEGFRTRDIFSPGTKELTTDEMGDAVLSRIQK